jgi:hypothetical protein
MIRMWCSCVPPRVKYESEIELREACFTLLEAYVELTHRVVGERIRKRGQIRRHEWTEMDRLMLGIATFDEITEQALDLVLTSTKGNGVLYAHDLNTRIMLCINRHNFKGGRARTPRVAIGCCSWRERCLELRIHKNPNFSEWNTSLCNTGPS